MSKDTPLTDAIRAQATHAIQAATAPIEDFEKLELKYNEARKAQAELIDIKATLASWPGYEPLNGVTEYVVEYKDSTGDWSRLQRRSTTPEGAAAHAAFVFDGYAIKPEIRVIRIEKTETVVIFSI